MIKKLKHYLKETLYFIIFITLLTNGISFYKSSDLNKEKLNLTEVHLLDNSIYKLDNTKPILIHFWATWCPTCKLEAQNIEYLSHYYEVLTIAVQSGTDEELHKYLQEHHYTFKLINDQDGSYSNKFNIVGYPTTFIYDKNQNLVFSEVGYTSTFG
jgi:thiol-disulfide isomerase/thioredoxin